MNPFFAAAHLALWLLISGLFFPRLALVVAWLGLGGYPPNPLSDLANFFLWLFVPRFLMAYYIYVNAGTNNIWFWAYLVLGLFALIGEPGYMRRRVVRRRTVVQNGGGATTTTDEIVE